MFFSRIVENIEKFSSSIGQPHPPLGTGTTTVCAFDVQTSELANVTAGISSWVSKPSANSIRRRLRRAFKFAWAQRVGTWLSDAGNKSACCADWLSSLSSITASSAAVVRVQLREKCGLSGRLRGQCIVKILRGSRLRGRHLVILLLTTRHAICAPSLCLSHGSCWVRIWCSVVVLSNACDCPSAFFSAHCCTIVGNERVLALL